MLTAQHTDPFVEDVSQVRQYSTRHESAAGPGGLAFVHFAVTFWILAFRILGVPNVACAAGKMFDELIPPPSDSSAEMDLLYTDPSGKTVMQYDVGWPGQVRVYYTDGRPLFDIDDRLAYRLAGTPYLVPRFAKQHGLSMLDLSFFGIDIKHIIAVSSDQLDAPMCQWPYSTVYMVSPSGRPRSKRHFSTAA